MGQVGEIRDRTVAALDRVGRRLARAEGRRDALKERAQDLEQDIALAKGRLAVREEVETLIEAMQADATRRSLASFETLLTALVAEVLPGEKPVVLELTTERGLAALDICVVRADGTREDVLEDNGGALTNVIGMALRLIAVVKAGAGRFLALDEPDCWIAPDRVPAFYRVLQDSAARLGVQCLVISHHDLSGSDAGLRVSRVVGRPETGVTLACPDPDGTWEEDQPGIRFIRLVDVQGYGDSTLGLSPGVNALVGPNNTGKSTFIRALRAVFYGEARDSLVRAGAATARVELGLAGGRILRFLRQPRRSPVNLWSLHEADGSVVEEGGTRFETGGRAPPEWVERLCGIAKVEGLDLHIAHQKFPVFLLGEPPSRRSAVLSVGQEAGYFRDMLAIHRERCTRDLALVRNGERELAATRETLQMFEALPSLGEALVEARGLAADVAVGAGRLEALEIARSRLQRLSSALETARRRSETLAGLPQDDALAGIAARIQSTEHRERIARRVIETARTLRRAEARAEVLKALPEAEPSLAEAAPAEQTRERLAGLVAALAAAERRRQEAEAGMQAVSAEIAAIIAASDGQCPTCGAPIDPETALRGHRHAA